MRGTLQGIVPEVRRWLLHIAQTLFKTSWTHKSFGRAPSLTAKNSSAQVSTADQLFCPAAQEHLESPDVPRGVHSQLTQRSAPLAHRGQNHTFDDCQEAAISRVLSGTVSSRDMHTFPPPTYRAQSRMFERQTLAQPNSRLAGSIASSRVSTEQFHSGMLGRAAPTRIGRAAAEFTRRWKSSFVSRFAESTTSIASPWRPCSEWFTTCVNSGKVISWENSDDRVIAHLRLPNGHVSPDDFPSCQAPSFLFQKS